VLLIRLPKIVRLLTLSVSVCMIGLVACFPTQVRTTYVHPRTPVRLRETLKNVKVWVYDKDGNAQASEMDIPEGWYALTDPGIK